MDVEARSVPSSSIDNYLGKVGGRNYENYRISDKPIVFPENMLVMCEKGGNQREYDPEWVNRMADKMEETGKSMFSQPMAATLLEKHVCTLQNRCFCLDGIYIYIK